MGQGVCGDNLVSWPEQCEDGNDVSGDGCSSCILDVGYVCNELGCHLVECGNGVQEEYGDGQGFWDYERCDDGNTSGGDGCSSECSVEVGYICQAGAPCREVVCGDGFIDSYYVPGGSAGTGGANSGTGGSGGVAGAGGGTWGVYVSESCDDLNTEDGDGCDSTCNVEPGYICPFECDYDTGICGPAPCYQPACGDGRLDFIATGGTAGTAGGVAGSGGGGFVDGYYETCDDLNTEDGDGCDSTCNIEPGYICPFECDYDTGLCGPEPCYQPACGDGRLDFIATGGSGGSGGPGGGAGGSAGTGGSAGGTGGVGGGFVGGYYENCDDANDEPGDGCSAECLHESGYSCPTPGEPCKLAACGDGVTDWPVEECDDGNTEPGDWCTPTCEYDYQGGFGGAGGTFGTGGSGGVGGIAGGVPVGGGGAGG